MGYLNAENQKQVITHIVKLMKDVKLIRQSDNIGVNVNGENELAVRSLAHFDVDGKIDVHDLADVIKTIRTDNPKFRDDYPHFDDKQLRWLDSIDAYTEASSDVIRRYMQPAAIDSGLKKRFDERVTFLRNNNIRRPKVEATTEPPQLTPEQ